MSVAPWNELLIWVRIIADTATFVLIILVQVIIYPSFLYYSPKDLVEWHSVYFRRIGIIVAPMLALQMLAVILSAILDPSPYSVISLLVVTAIWIQTFWAMAPRHLEMERGDSLKIMGLAKELVSKNRWRTWGWSLVFFMTVLQGVLHFFGKN